MPPRRQIMRHKKLPQKLSILLSVLFVAIFIAAQAFAGNTFYVTTSGNDSNPGTQALPWGTIQKAANTMAAGDSVIVGSGNYSGQRATITKSGTSGNPITYQAQGAVTMKG